jgi:hypothetical protein
MSVIIGTTERRAQGLLFTVLAAGEALAHDCALGQARLTANPRQRRFFTSQARQEAMHRRLFESAALCLVPKGVGNPAEMVHVNAYRTLIESALDRDNLAETLLAQQVVMEGLGEAVLERVDYGLSTRGYGFGRLRRMLLRQEHAHHLFGVRQLQHLLAEPGVSRSQLCERASVYQALSEEMLHARAPLFEFFDEDPQAYARSARRNLPAWLTDDCV